MKLIKIILIPIYTFVYIYSAYMAGQEPNRPIWGFICVIIFGIFSILAIKEFVKYESEHKNYDE